MFPLDVPLKADIEERSLDVRYKCLLLGGIAELRSAASTSGFCISDRDTEFRMLS